MEIAHTLGLMEASTHAHKAPRMLPDQPPTIGVEPGMLDLTSVERTDLCENVKHRDALTRIGTDSQFSEVYLNDDKVLKVMPYTFEQTPQECRTEFEIAKMLSSNDDGDPDKFVSSVNLRAMPSSVEYRQCLLQASATVVAIQRV